MNIKHIISKVTYKTFLNINNYNHNIFRFYEINYSAIGIATGHRLDDPWLESRLTQVIFLFSKTFLTFFEAHTSFYLTNIWGKIFWQANLFTYPNLVANLRKADELLAHLRAFMDSTGTPFFLPFVANIM